jgi:hypothetical protein
MKNHTIPLGMAHFPFLRPAHAPLVPHPLSLTTTGPHRAPPLFCAGRATHARRGRAATTVLTAAGPAAHRPPTATPCPPCLRVVPPAPRLPHPTAPTLKGRRPRRRPLFVPSFFSTPTTPREPPSVPSCICPSLALEPATQTPGEKPPSSPPDPHDEAPLSASFHRVGPPTHALLGFAVLHGQSLLATSHQSFPDDQSPSPPILAQCLPHTALEPRVKTSRSSGYRRARVEHATAHANPAW